MANSYGRKVYWNLSQIERAIRNLSELLPSSYVDDFYRDYMYECYYSRYHDNEEKLFYMLSHNGSLIGFEDGKIYSLPDSSDSV